MILLSSKLSTIVFSVLLIWLVGIFYNFLLYFIPDLVSIYPIVNKCYSLVCHQDKEKLIHIFNLPLLVCGRCIGIYSGLFITSLINLFTQKNIDLSTKSLIIFSMPMLFDIIGNITGFYNYSIIVAFVTGLLFGTVLFLYFYNIIHELFENIIRENN